jgi:hypothetical protein
MEEIDDWEIDGYIPVLQSEETKKRLEERKQQEEADLDISKGLFGNEIKNEITNEITKVTKTNRPKVSKRAENELKQKALSEALGEKKAKKARHAEVYGECSEDEYTHYEDKFNH